MLLLLWLAVVAPFAASELLHRLRPSLLPPLQLDRRFFALISDEEQTKTLLAISRQSGNRSSSSHEKYSKGRPQRTSHLR